MNAWTVPATVVRVHDGDTLVADLDLGWHVTLQAQSIRLARINAPELSTPSGKAALAFIDTLLGPGDHVTVLSHELDKYGRVLGEVSLADGRNLSDVMVAAGHAVPWDGHGAKPVA